MWDDPVREGVGSIDFRDGEQSIAVGYSIGRTFPDEKKGRSKGVAFVLDAQVGITFKYLMTHCR